MEHDSHRSDRSLTLPAPRFQQEECLFRGRYDPAPGFECSLIDLPHWILHTPLQPHDSVVYVAVVRVGSCYRFSIR